METKQTVSAAEVHKLVLARLYHEDTLLTQRTYNYLTFNVFLAAILAFKGVNGMSLGPFGYLVAAMGAIISILQVAFGRRIETAIDFWRVYARAIEEKAEIPVDHLLFIFYKTGEVDTPWGTISKREVNRKAVFKTLPWRWMPSTNTMIGVLLPFLIGTLWFLAMIISLKNAWLLAVVAIVWFCTMFLTWFWPLPATPKRTFIKASDRS